MTEPTLSQLARAGFVELTESRDRLMQLCEQLGVEAEALLAGLSLAADPDRALLHLINVEHARPGTVRELLAGGGLPAAAGQVLGVVAVPGLEPALPAPGPADEAAHSALSHACLLLGASNGFGSFFTRHPHLLLPVASGEGRLMGQEEAAAEMLAATSHICGEAGWNALRVEYRRQLAELMLWSLLRARGALGPHDHFEQVADALSDLAGAAIEASLALARRSISGGEAGVPVPAEQLERVGLAVVAMGKCGARELNVVSDVDVMFIAREVPSCSEGVAHAGGTADEAPLGDERLLRLATRLASETMRGIHDPALEPPLWQLDPNLRPEGKQGPLVRTLGSMLSYYERWAKAWEFQALLKARAIAGDIELGEEFVARTRDAVWSSSAREDFVGSVQRMRERVTEHISPEESDIHIKLGEGGLRDIEFSAQLLQLVHGSHDESLRVAGTIPALRALVAGGYVARADGERLDAHYRFLRLLEHRLQLRELRRTALMPRGEEQLRQLARASGLAATAEELTARWERVKIEVRELHLKIFYAPLLSAVAALPNEEFQLDTEAAALRLASAGFADPQGALRHLAALTRGTSRRAQIQRNLMPVLLRLLADGTDPDGGLLAFRRLSEANIDTPWYLRLLRDGSEAAERLMRVLSCSRFASELLIAQPEAVAWLERNDTLAPPAPSAVREEMQSLAGRRTTADSAAKALRAVHRREVLRLALARVTGVVDDAGVAAGLHAAHTSLLGELLAACEREIAGDGAPRAEICLVGMGRFGGEEMGFASDLDVIAVYRALPGEEPDRAERYARKVVTLLRDQVSDPRFQVELDFDLRPEGKKGPLVRSLPSTINYYQSWAETWELQALTRAAHVAGSEVVAQELFAALDPLRYPEGGLPLEKTREIRAMKARVETERLPQGADPARHVKLGPGGISDVEWLVQLLQLRHAGAHPQLRTTSTLQALDAAAELGLLTPAQVSTLAESWQLATSIRNAVKLWNGQNADSLPADWHELQAVATLLGDSPPTAAQLQEQWLRCARRARRVFDDEFFG